MRFPVSQLRKIGNMRLRWLWLAVFSLIVISSGITAQDNPTFPPGADYYVEAEVSNASPYVGEEITYIFRYYAFALTAGLYDELPNFEGFWLSDVEELVTPRIETVNNRQYSVMEVYATLSPLRVGQISIGPAILDIPETLFDDANVLETHVVTIDVQPIPDGAPENFAGAVGQFDLTVSVSETSTTVGQPISMRVVINGAGSLERITAPRLPELDEWRAYQSAVDNRSSDIGGLRLGEKTFEWLLIPDMAGTQTIPPVTFSYFNPQDQTFITLSGEAFSIEVFPSASGERRLERPSNADENALALFAVYGSLQKTVWRADGAFWLLWLIAPLVCFGIGGYHYGYAYFEKRSRAQRQIQAFAHLTRNLTATENISAEEFSRRSEQALLNFVAEKSAQSVSTQADAERILRGKITAEGVDLFLRHFSEAQAMRYIPSSHQTARQQFIDSALDTMRKIDRSWRA